MNYLYILIVLLLVLFLYNLNNTEHFYNNSGTFCYTCNGKSINDCLKCFNCGFCVDKWGNSRCMGGDHNGPFNFEKCAFWYYIDPFTKMQQMNKNYKLSYGPRNYNRLIGI